VAAKVREKPERVAENVIASDLEFRLRQIVQYGEMVDNALQQRNAPELVYDLCQVTFRFPPYHFWQTRIRTECEPDLLEASP
jgi:hypothetical protein